MSNLNPIKKLAYCNKCNNGLIQHWTAWVEPVESKTGMTEELVKCFCCGTVYHKKSMTEERAETTYFDGRLRLALENYQKDNYSKLEPFITLINQYFFRISLQHLQAYKKSLIYTDVSLFFNYSLNNLRNVLSRGGEMSTLGKSSSFEVKNLHNQNMLETSEPLIFIYMTDIFEDNDITNSWNPQHYAVFCIKNNSVKNKNLAFPKVFEIVSQ